jgi:L-ascorbate metabolism protein UlaG (beta-lactamase superfamily)
VPGAAGAAGSAGGSGAPFHARITFVGHATTAIEVSGTRLLTDPTLRRRILGLLRRRHPRPGDDVVEGLDAILISHLHHDHLDLPSLRSVPGRPPIVIPRGGGRFLRRRGFEPVVELAPGESTRVGEVEVTAVPAVHGGGIRRPGAGGADYVGYVIDDGRAAVYFAGDTELFDGMAEIGAMGLDLALLPIWGWGPNLGPGHLDPHDAARALALLRPRIAVPIHWGTYTPIFAPRLWPWLLADPARRFAEHAARLAPDVDVRVLQPGEVLEAGKELDPLEEGDRR